MLPTTPRPLLPPPLQGLRTFLQHIPGQRLPAEDVQKDLDTLLGELGAHLSAERLERRQEERQHLLTDVCGRGGGGSVCEVWGYWYTLVTGRGQAIM